MARFLGKHKRYFWVLLLVLYGCISAYCLVLPYYRSISPEFVGSTTFMPIRVKVLTSAIEHMQSGQSVQVGTDGNNALYILYAAFSVALGITNGEQAFWVVLMGTCFVLLASYPLTAWFAFKSLPVSIASPFILCYFVSDLTLYYKTDVYWASFVVVAVCTPLFAFLWRRAWDKWSWLVFAAICAWISLANVPRFAASMSVFTLCGITVFFKLLLPAWKERGSFKSFIAKFKWVSSLVAVMALSVSFFLLNSIFPTIYYAANGVTKTAAAGQFWHTAYIGLGYQENPYGLEYLDECADRVAREVNPNVVPYTKEYGDILQDKWFALLRDDPAFMARTYYLKFTDALIQVKQNILPSAAHSLVITAAPVYVLLLLFFANREIIKKYRPILLLLLVSIPFGLVDAMISMPWSHYMMAAIASVRIMSVFLIFIGIECLQRALQQWRQKQLAHKAV